MAIIVLSLVLLLIGILWCNFLPRKTSASELHSWECPECLSLVQVKENGDFTVTTPGLEINRLAGIWSYCGSPPIEIGCAKRFVRGGRTVVIVVLYLMEIPSEPQTAFGPFQPENIRAIAENMIKQARQNYKGFVPNVHCPDDRVIHPDPDMVKRG